MTHPSRFAVPPSSFSTIVELWDEYRVPTEQSIFFDHDSSIHSFSIVPNDAYYNGERPEGVVSVRVNGKEMFCAPVAMLMDAFEHARRMHRRDIRLTDLDEAQRPWLKMPVAVNRNDTLTVLVSTATKYTLCAKRIAKFDPR